jgi:tetratricopeptide (TPR) repeat protein
MPNRSLVLGFFLTVALSLSGGLILSYQDWTAKGGHRGGVLNRMFGDGRRMFANHFFAKADAYFHRGFYPSIFEQGASQEEDHMTEGTHEEHGHSGHGQGSELYGLPRDWIERLNHHTLPTRHVELENGDTREILPWLKLSAELDPHWVDTYTVAAYWLRTRLGKSAEAEQFLRVGLNENPDSYEILYELGRLIETDHNDLRHACNVFEIALKKWERTEAAKPEPDKLALGQILIALARAEEKQGDLGKALSHLERLKTVSPNPQAIQAQIDELRSRPVAPQH